MSSFNYTHTVNGTSNALLLLSDESVLKMFHFVGAGEGIFINSVDKRLQKLYPRVPLHRVNKVQNKYRAIKYTTETTLCSAICASSGRLEWAHRSGFQFITAASMYTLGAKADVQSFRYALAQMHFYHLPSSVEIIAGVISTGDVAKVEWYLQRSSAMRTQTEQFQQGMCWGAAEQGHNTMLAWLLNKGLEPDARSMEVAALHNHLGTVQYLFRRGGPLDANLARCAALSGNVASLKWLHSVLCPFDAKACEAAAQHGHLAALKWLHESGCPWYSRPTPFRGHPTEYIVNSAARSGNLDMLKWLQKVGLEPVASTTQTAAYAGHVHVLKWLREYCGQEFTETTMETVAAQTCFEVPIEEELHLDVVEYLCSQGCPWSPKLSTWVAAHGTMQQLEWLFEHGSPFIAPDVGIAAVRGTTGNSVTVLTFLKERLQREDEFTAETLEAAVHSTLNSMETVKYLHSVACPWSAKCCQYAASKADFNELKWLHEQGCPWDIHTALEVVFTKPHTTYDVCDRLEYLIQEQLLTTTQQFTQLLNFAGVYNNRTMAEWLRERGVEWPAQIGGPLTIIDDPYYYDTDWSQDMVDWARACGCTSPIFDDYSDEDEDEDNDGDNIVVEADQEDV